MYDIIFKLLDQAITGLHNPPAVDQYSFSAEDDRIYGGKVEPWIRFANTLRLRLALRVSNVAPEVAREQGEKALSDPSGLMKGQEDNMKLIPKRQWITGGNENIFALMFSWGASCVLPKEMEWAYKNQALKEGVDANASGFVEKVARNADEKVLSLDWTLPSIMKKKRIAIWIPVARYCSSVLHPMIRESRMIIKQRTPMLNTADTEMGQKKSVLSTQ